MSETTLKFFYPHAGDELPSHRAANLILLTKGCCVTIGSWNADFCLGWAYPPERNIGKEDTFGQRA